MIIEDANYYIDGVLDGNRRVIAKTITLVESSLPAHQELSKMIIFSIGLAVAAVPEGLPAVLTLSLAIAINKMARKKSLIRRLPAVEVLGSATVICTDKTGTLTKNEMTVKQVWTNDYIYNITGTGYQDNGDILNAKRKFDAHNKMDNIS